MSVKRMTDIGERSTGGLPSTIHVASASPTVGEIERPGNVAAACEMEAVNSWNWAEDVMTVSGHCGDATAKFSHFSRLQDWQLILHFGRS